jgi:hypothetical protein
MVAERVDQRGNNHPIPGSPRMEHRIRQAPGLIQFLAAAGLGSQRFGAALPSDIDRADNSRTGKGKPGARHRSPGGSGSD